MKTMNAKRMAVLEYVARVNRIIRVHAPKVAAQSARALWRDINPAYAGPGWYTFTR